MKRPCSRLDVTAALGVLWESRTGIAHVEIRLGADLLLSVLDSVGVDGWNDLRKRLDRANECPSVFSLADVPPVMVLLDCRGANLSGRKLDGIDLTSVTLDNADFRGCSLAAARFGSVRHADLSQADLRASSFELADVTGTVFRAADLYGVRFAGACYFQETPPVSLSPVQLGRCKALSPDHPFRRPQSAPPP